MHLVRREWCEEDAAALARAIQESLDHLRPWMPWAAAEPVGVDRRRAWIRELAEARAAGGRDRTYGMFVAGEIVGGCGLHDRIGPGGMEIGYWVHVAHVRRGIATEAVRRLAAEAFSLPDVDHVEIRHDAANEPSGRVAAAAGFTLVQPDGPQRIWRLEKASAASRQRNGSAGAR